MGTTAEVLAVYGKDYYKGAPVITKNTYGAETAYHIAANCEDALIKEKYINILDDEEILGKVCLEPYGIVTLEEKVIC